MHKHDICLGQSKLCTQATQLITTRVQILCSFPLIRLLGFSDMSKHHHHHHIIILSCCQSNCWAFCFHVNISRNHRFIPPSVWVSASRLTTIYGSPVCYLACPSIVLKASYVTGQSPFSGFNDVHDVTNLGFAPYRLLCPMILPGHTNHCPFHISLSSC